MKDRRADLINRIGKDKVKSLDGEAGQPVENLTDAQFNELYSHVAREKGWSGAYKPAF